MNAKIRSVNMTLECPHCGELVDIHIWTGAPIYLHNGSRKKECGHCYQDFYYHIAVQKNLDDLPDYIAPIRSF